MVGTVAVLALSPRRRRDTLRQVASKLAAALADELDAALGGTRPKRRWRPRSRSSGRLLARFTATPYRPTGLATADQALANVVELLEWCTALVRDCIRSAPI